MAEGVEKSPVKLKPVPPPKPTGTTLTPPKSGCKLRRSTDISARFSAGDRGIEPPELGTRALKNAGTPSDHESNISPFSSAQGSRILPKPPLLPKPHLAHVQSKRIQFQPSPTLSDGTSGVIRKLPIKLFIPKPKTSDVENGGSPGIVEVRAPVAKLEEFDPVSPVRPPRSPKTKNLAAGPFVSEAIRRQQILSLHQVDAYKSTSLGRNVSPLELKTKSCSLGRSEVRNIAQVLEGSGSFFSALEDRSPVRPPRRRNKSITQSPEVVSPTQPDGGFQFGEVQSTIPVYAQVNYSSKKNRRSKDSCSSPGDTPQNEETGPAECVVGLETVEIAACEMVCAERSELEADEVKEKSETLHKVESEECVNETKEEVVESDYTYVSFTSSRIIPDHTLDDAVRSKAGSTADGSISDISIDQNLSAVSELALSSVHNDMCTETCADCLPVQILEESGDGSISSSKLDWHSVRSSLNSSGSDVAGEAGVTSRSIESSAERTTLPTQCISQNTQTLEGKSAEVESTVSNVGNSCQKKECSNNCEFLCKCDTDSSNLSAISFSSDIKLDSPSERRRQYKWLTSSLPTRKPCRRPPRRQSWTGYKDSSHYGEWNTFGQPNWLDEGESSSGNMGDVDSSDNAVKQSSAEEVSSKTKSDQSVSKRLNLWLSSFGKSGKRSRSAKRNSHFYCERQDSSGGEPRQKDGSSDKLKLVPSAPIPVSPAPQVSSSCSILSSPATPQLQCNDLCDKVTSEESIVSDLQSDSDGEGDDGSYAEGNQTNPEPQSDSKKAFYIANELMTSEQVFIKALKLLNVDFRHAIHKANSHGNPVIPSTELDKILNSLPQLQRLNEDLLCDLEERIQNWSSLKKIADVIVKKGPFLKLYASYIQNFEAQCNFFDECCQKYPKFSKTVREFESSSVCQKLSVKHYMLKPVQRIPQYRLLLDDYSRHLDPSSPDFEDTQTALKIVCEVADHANRSIKLGDHLSVLLQLQSQLGNFEIIKPGRVLLKEGELYKLSRKERQPRYFILLNDCLLYTTYYGSGPSSGLKVNSELSLGGMKVTVPQAEDYHNEFSIISSTRSFTLSARSSSERQKWVEALQNAIQEYTSRQLSFQVQKLNITRPDGSSEFKLGKEAPIWIQDGRVTKCQSCVAEFTVTFRRHHCRACGKVVCGTCSAFRAPLQYMKFQADRVCEDCFYTLLREFDTPGSRIAEVIKVELGLKKCDQNTVGSIRSQFKRLGPSSGKKTKKNIPQRLLEVTANDSGSQMCGWLQRRTKRSWKRLWFVLKEQVLYVYKASEDVVALETIPVLGYKVEPMKQNHFQLYEGIDAKLVFQLAHPNQQPLVFSADNENLVNRWIAELQEATVLK